MKKSLALMAVLGCFSQSSMAADFDLNKILGAQATADSTFEALVGDLGAAFSYKPVTPAAALGITGFDVGIQVTATDMGNSADKWKSAGGGDAPFTYLPVPKLYAAKGLPLGIDIAGYYTSIPTTKISAYGIGLSYAILDGGIAMPAIAVRGAYTKLSGVDTLSLSTKSLDVSISKGFVGFSPYAGAGVVMIDGSSTATLGPVTLKDVGLTKMKFFAGLNLNLGLPNVAMEFDSTGGVSSYSAKVGLRW